MKLLPTLISGVFFIAACSTNTNKLTREKIVINKEVFYGVRYKFDNNTIINQMSFDMEKAFSLVPLKESSAEKEIRIYFASAWHEIYFVEKYQDDSLYVEIYNCENDNKHDSLFMKINSSIKASGKYDITKITKDDALPILKSCLVKDTIKYLDKGYVYFIQTKTGKVVKNILMNDNCGQLTNDKEITHINNFIESLGTNWNFAFYDSWERIDSLAFNGK